MFKLLLALTMIAIDVHASEYLVDLLFVEDMSVKSISLVIAFALLNALVINYILTPRKNG
jgi:exoribonuclease II